MRPNRASITSDVALLAFLLLCLGAVVYVSGDSGRYIQNLIALNLSFLFAVIAYFISPAAGLILNVLFLFGYGSFVLYQSITRGEPIGPGTYFWLGFAPLLTVASWLMSSSQRQLQEENRHLRRQKEQLATLDEGTDLRTSLSFLKDAEVFAGLSVRYGIPLTLLVLRIKYWNEIRRFIPEEELAGLILDISRLGEASIRTNDTLYMLEKENATWGLLLFTDQEGAKVVTDRLRQRLYEFNTSGDGGKQRVKLVLRIGAAQYNADTAPSALELMEQAKKQLEFDVQK